MNIDEAIKHKESELAWLKMKKQMQEAQLRDDDRNINTVLRAIQGCCFTEEQVRTITDHLISRMR